MSAAIDWAALEAAAPRYAVVVAEAGLAFPRSAARSFDVVDRAQGTATTDFGAPDRTTDADLRGLGRAGASRLAELVAASWRVLADVAAGAPPELRKGPRGGGRDRDAIVQHVIGADAAYARRLGLRQQVPDPGDEAGVGALRRSILDALRTAPSAEPLAEKGWAPRYAARRLAWHALNHAWEIEDRS